MSPDVIVEEPGVYDMPAELYHGDPVPGGSLSSSGARKLLPPSCPAIYRHERDHPPEPRKAFELGHAAHKLVLGVGPQLTLVDRDRWDTKAVKEQVATIREAGGVPLKRPEYEQVHAMAESLRAHPMAAALFNPDHGAPERALFWRDPRTAVWLRALVDWLPEPQPGRRMILSDYKTTSKSAHPQQVARTMADYGYHIQLAWNAAGVRALGLAHDVAPLLVVQETTPPYLVTVAQPNDIAMRVAKDAMREAIDIYAQCVRDGRWPGYSDEVELVGLPPWIENEYMREMML